MKIKMRLVWIIGIVLFQISFFACVNNGKTDESKTDLIEFEDDEPELDEKIFYRFPSPEEVFKYVQSSDLQFNSGAPNHIGPYKNYMGLKKQAINLGVYISDIAYITMFEQQEVSLEYFMVIHKLSEELNISDAYSSPLVSRIGNNMNNADSLIVIAGDAYNNIVDYLVEHEQEDILAYIATGALIESLCLMLDYADVYNKDDKIIQRVLDQKYVVGNLTDYVKQHQKDTVINNELEKLNAMFLALGTVEVETTVEKTESNKLVIGGGSELSINEEDFVKMKKLIQNMRLNYVKIQ